MSYVLFTLLCIFSVVITTRTTATSCTWPPWFDISATGWRLKLEQHSWETNAIIKTDITTMVNWYIKSKRMVTILSNSTLEITTYSEKNKGNGTLYTCEQNMGNLKFLIKKTGIKTRFMETIDIPVTYTCIQLIQRSRFVAQWRVGSESSQPQLCADNFAPISPWPLVYFPVRETAPQSEIWKLHDLLNDYPRCPPLGGFLVRVYEGDGTPIEDSECKNDYPSSRFEVECVDGEGIRITTSTGKCMRYGTGNRIAAKFFCLSNWEDDRYRYSVLMPNVGSRVNSFHCLRTDKNDPTNGHAILFLDTVCRSSDPELSDNYFRLSLRRHPVKGLCADLSDQCDRAQCHNMKYWCASTCNSCANISETIPTDESIRGTWLLQKSGKQEEFQITDTSFTLPGLGTFHAFGNLSQERRVCLAASGALREDTFQYALARLPDQEGCGPRVTQLRIRRVSESVLVLQAPGTAPLRPDQYMTDPGQWCHNNYRDVDWHSSVFTPHWPFFSTEGMASIGTGSFTLINKNIQTPTKCLFDEYPLAHAAHMKVKIEFSSGGRKHECIGETHVGLHGDDKYEIQYKCEDKGTSGSIIFECLANYKVSDNYRGLILQAPPTGSDNHGIPTKDRFYCLLVPNDQSDKNPLFYNTAGECDLTFGAMVISGYREALAKITPLEYLYASGAAQLSRIPILILLSLLMLYMLFH